MKFTFSLVQFLGIARYVTLPVILRSDFVRTTVLLQIVKGDTAHINEIGENINVAVYSAWIFQWWRSDLLRLLKMGNSFQNIWGSLNLGHILYILYNM